MSAPTVSDVDPETLAEGLQECHFTTNRLPHAGKMRSFYILHECCEGFLCEAHHTQYLEDLAQIDSLIRASGGARKAECCYCYRRAATTSGLVKVYPL